MAGDAAGGAEAAGKTEEELAGDAADASDASDDEGKQVEEGGEEGADDKAEEGGKKRKGGPGNRSNNKRQRPAAPSSDELNAQAATGFVFVLHSSGGAAVTGTMQIPAAYVGNVIGKGGFTIKYIQQGTGCDVTFEKEVVGAGTRDVTLKGTAQAVSAAQQMIVQAITNAAHRQATKREELGMKSDEPIVERRIRGAREKMGWIIGQKGATIKAIRTISGASLDVLEEETAGTVPVGCVIIRGTAEAVQQAQVAVEGLLAYTDTRLAKQYSAKLQETAEQLIAYKNSQAEAAMRQMAAPVACAEGAGAEGGADGASGGDAGGGAGAGSWETIVTKHPDGSEIRLYKHSGTGEIRWG